MARHFGSAAAFKASLEAHLRKLASERNTPLSTLQLKLVIERLLARLFHATNPPWLLKGGFAMDLRFRPRARTTKDVDLSLILGPGDSVEYSTGFRERLQEVVDVDLGDYLSYRISIPKHELTNAPLGGARYPCEAVLVGKSYAKFHIDVGVGDVLVGDPERILGDDLLSFAGIPPAEVLAISKPQQFAEKVHAYTFAWKDRLNTRTKDLVDLVLIIERGLPNAPEIQSVLTITFAARATHPIPERLQPPPETWARDFPAMAIEAGLSTSDYLEAFSLLDAYWTANSFGGTASH
jgi:Nucleotidyl transferase AbiEii toxin, Type IV TA system